MTRSLDAMRLWLQQEIPDIARIQWLHGFIRAKARQAVIERIGIEMRLDGYRIEDYHIEVNAIVEKSLDELYRTERKVDVETMDTQATQEDGILRDTGH
jgi:hypothetical protein